MDSKIWLEKPKEVAKSLLGRDLIVGRYTVAILGTKGFTRKENETGVYRPMLEMSPGSVYCPWGRSGLLLLIVTQDGGMSGGCVLIRTIGTNNGIIDGPNLVCKALGLSVQKSQGRTEWVDERTVAIHLDSVRELSQPKTRPIASINGIGMVTFQRYIHAIVRKYLKDKPGINFHQYLNDILAACKTEADLKKWLR